jgi:hypothetical protein
MNKFWKSIIAPLFEIVKPSIILEIGINDGRNTKNILEYCKNNDAKVIAIDPAPKIDVAAWELAYRGYLEFYIAKSLDVIESLPSADIVLLDGDHNWYTVYNELNKIYNMGLPITLIHDIDWPYGRRDMYYNPSDIPAEYRQPYKLCGISFQLNRLEKNGFNYHLYHAETEGGECNGVLTAIQDFLRENSQKNFELIKVPGHHGLGILFSRNYNCKRLEKFFRELIPNKYLEEHIKSLEHSLIEERMKVQHKYLEIEELKKELEMIKSKN